MPAIPASGAISLSDFAAEFGGTAPHSMSEYYRDGGRVPSNNSNVPTAGAFRFGNMRGAVNEIAAQAINSTNLDVSTLFGANWTSTVPKRLTIPSGVTIGGTGSSAALIVPATMAGTLAIDNAGSIIGYGGTSGSAGGNGIQILVAGVTVNNTNLIAGGGGGGGSGGSGGTGGQGGQGRYTYVGYSSYTNCPGSCHSGLCGGNQYLGCSQSTVPGPMDSTRTQASCICGQLLSGGAGGTGGTGGAGGVGQGYSQSAATGSSGSTGSTGGAGATGPTGYGGTGGTGGTGGLGGNGGAYGQSGTSGSSGSTGGTGANGNYGNGLAGSAGSAGASGGAAGAAVIYTVGYTMNNTGTLAGAA